MQCLCNPDGRRMAAVGRYEGNLCFQFGIPSQRRVRVRPFIAIVVKQVCGENTRSGRIERTNMFFVLFSRFVLEVNLLSGVFAAKVTWDNEYLMEGFLGN